MSSSLSKRLLASLALLVAAALLLARSGSAASPPLVGRILPADGGSVAGMRVYVRGASFSDSATVDSTGRFTVALPERLRGDSLELFTNAADSAAIRYYPALVRLFDEQLAAEQGVVLVPREWTIPTGRFAGRTVRIDLDRAFRPVCDECTGFYRNLADGPSRGQVRTWPEEVFPLRVVFDREFSGASISARDSTAFWRAVDEMEADLGADLFRPARFADALPVNDVTSNDVIFVQIDPAMHMAGLGVTGTEGGTVTYGEVRVKSGSLLTGPEGTGLVSHEMLHALGFGHTCSWHTVMAVAARCGGMSSDRLTEEDVAYAQLARQVRGVQQSRGARWGMEAALAAAREIRSGRPLLPPVVPDTVVTRLEA
ncbi:MAG: hypothetical protein JO040_01475 [Gemmatimonadetes bacterium]|nr:hypothetical protein [Gemmatimonadota bacterium]